MSKKKTIAVFDMDGKYISHCTYERAMKIINSNKGYFIGKCMLKLNINKIQKIEKKHKIIRESDRICYICTMKIPLSEHATVDHVIPKSRDEKADTHLNLKCCCERCNNDKNNRTLSEYVKHIKQHREDYKYITDMQLAYLEEYAKQYEKNYFGFLKKYLNSEGNVI